MTSEKLMKITEIHGQVLLGIDYGEKVIGLALYKVGMDPFPQPYGRIVVSRTQNPLQDIKNIVDDEVVDRIILGLPHLTDGQESKMTLHIKKWGDELSSFLGDIPLHHQDETLSTYEAEQRMKNDPRYNFKVDLQKIDELAASIIIEQFLQEQIDHQEND